MYYLQWNFKLMFFEDTTNKNKIFLLLNKNIKFNSYNIINEIIIKDLLSKVLLNN